MQARIESLERQHDEDVMRLHGELASDRRRLTALEEPPVKLSSCQVDRLYSEMTAIGRIQVDVRSASKMLGVTRQRVHQLIPSIAIDSRFQIIKSESHSNKRLIRLNIE